MKAADLIVDNSILVAVAQCDTRAAVEYGLGYTAKEAAAELQAGSAVHAGYAALFSGASTEEALGVFRAAYRPFAEREVARGDRLWWEQVEKILGHHFRTRPVAKFPLRVQPGHVEVALGGDRSPIYLTEGIRFVGLLDLLGKKRVGSGGGWWVADHKSAKKISAWWVQDQKFSSQFSGYLWGARQQLKETVHGVLVHGVEVPQLNTSDRTCPIHKPQTYKMCALAHVKHEYIWVTRTAHELVSWERTAIKLAKRYRWLTENVRDFDDVRTVPMQGRFNRACKFCALAEFCELGRPARRAEKMLRKADWRPLDHVQRGVQKGDGDAKGTESRGVGARGV